MVLPIVGSCFCGSASWAIFSPPVISAYCHCTNCQRLTACPFVHTMHVQAVDFTWKHAEPHADKLDTYTNYLKPHKTRFRCKKCGACLASTNTLTQRISIWGALLERDENGNVLHWDIAKPTSHIFYDTRMLDVKDELPKWEGYENNSTRM
ncbi:hypothetical protein CONPUDRAFT_134439 [Coniophora puteana RWD-64-598 SS2]|uniref:CENP-V/GFA domain-containing protein n=1 Tax=Coniophora puteana (strain RWD-64-598) TaxID=741705 RepID=A0A5M3N750_CONPW|nr:uncharacterized protein CONPUDRAFT_134439 [Coniophora puteana RWD-64-598 SS2]EIW87146.1 hypothetical protein CONPUDRAFT_134439 [Coniophora puteana RWD-64-598 SS2]